MPQDPHRQQQFLDVIDRDEAERQFRATLSLVPLGPEIIPLNQALGRVLATDFVATIDVPCFDRSNYDGFAVQAADTFGADEENPAPLELVAESIDTGVVPRSAVAAGQAAAIATGGMLPRGADAVVMVEHTNADGGTLLVHKPVTSGFGVCFAGTDIACEETVLRRGQFLSSRETGVLAALGTTEVAVWRQPRVAVLSTGDEIIAPGDPLQPGRVYDSNARILADAVRETGGVPHELGIVKDDLQLMQAHLTRAIRDHDVVLLSGGTSKGAGDLSYRVVQQLKDPGIVAHGVALKPGKPICLASTAGKPVVILPGFPTSAIFTFHEFVAPVIRLLAGRSAAERQTIQAHLAVKINSDVGRTEFTLVGLIERPEADGPRYSAYPLGKGSGSVTTFSHADGFITIDRNTEIVPLGSTMTVQLLGRDLQLADFVVIGSHCIGLDFLLGKLHEQGFTTKFFAVGSTAGLAAARRGDCDIAGIHLFDAASQEYNRPFLTDDVELITGYSREQGIVFRDDDERFINKSLEQILNESIDTADCLMVNRNQGSGTRILTDLILDGRQPAGYAVQTKSHNAVVAAIVQHRADWGVAIRSVTHQAGIGFVPIRDERFDFVTPVSRRHRPAVAAFRRLLSDAEIRAELQQSVK